ncbi:MAG: hypothetical protein IT369_05700 [Candidatus Latescibacteria bacterium]|nr:hypothetical protein [Candidatus Latescibacterota bacterium]
MKESLWRAYHRHEQPVLGRWYEMLEAMGEEEMVVYHPCYQSAEERALAARGRELLGERFFTLSGRDITTAAGATPETMAALAPEIQMAFSARGKYAWAAHDLRVAVFSYNYAQDLLRLAAERRLSWDPERLALRAVGESFEGCVTTWSTMVPAYLGVPGRVQIPYEMTVPDTRFLLRCEYLRRVELAHHTALYLFADPQGRPVALYKRERVELADQSFYAGLPLEAGEVELRTSAGRSLLTGRGHLSAGVPPSLVRQGDAGLEVMVCSGRGRGGEGPRFYPREAPLFIAARRMGVEEFGVLAEQARIVPER